MVRRNVFLFNGCVYMNKGFVRKRINYLWEIITRFFFVILALKQFN